MLFCALGAPKYEWFRTMSRNGYPLRSRGMGSGLEFLLFVLPFIAPWQHRASARALRVRMFRRRVPWLASDARRSRPPCGRATRRESEPACRTPAYGNSKMRFARSKESRPDRNPTALAAPLPPPAAVLRRRGGRRAFLSCWSLIAAWSVFGGNTRWLRHRRVYPGGAVIEVQHAGFCSIRPPPGRARR